MHKAAAVYDLSRNNNNNNNNNQTAVMLRKIEKRVKTFRYLKHF